MIAPLWWCWDGAVSHRGLVGYCYDIDGPALAYCLKGSNLRYDINGPELSPYSLIGPSTDDDDQSTSNQPYELR